MKTLMTALLSLLLLSAFPHVYADDMMKKDGMAMDDPAKASKKSMKKMKKECMAMKDAAEQKDCMDKMHAMDSKDGMKKDSMKKDGMTKDGMKKDDMGMDKPAAPKY